MIVKSKEFKDACSSILAAIDNSELSNYTEALELHGVKDNLSLNVTNKEYYVSVKFKLEEELTNEFKAVIKAHTFLNLVKNITTEEIELKIKENSLFVKANGNYKFPLIEENGGLMELPKIKINNETLSMNIGGDILNSIVNFNSKILSKQEATPVQKLYYLDNEGCVTFTTCACINNFKLEKPVKILLNNKVVRLFKLFKEDLVQFHLGYDNVNETSVQTKIKLENNQISLVSILPRDTLLSQYPVAQLRALANKVYPFSAVIEVESFIGALNRLKLLNKDKDDCKFICNSDFITLMVGEDEENLKPANGSKIDGVYEMTLKLTHLKSILEACEEQYITFNFGNNNSSTLVRGSVVTVIPEVIDK